MASKPCCYPEQFVIGMGSVVGLSIQGKGAAYTTDSQLAFDFTNKREAELITVYSESEVSKYQIIYDYSENAQYTIDLTESVCQKTLLPGDMNHCVYANATFYRETYLGDNKLTVEEFGYFYNKGKTVGQMSLSVTKDECIPNGISFLGVGEGLPMTTAAGFFNYVEGIKDPDTFFTVPDLCPNTFSKKPRMYNPMLPGIFM